MSHPPTHDPETTARRSPGWLVFLGLVFMVGLLAAIIYFGVR